MAVEEVHVPTSKTPIILQGAQSLEKPLVQAVRSNDTELLKKITSNTNPTLINNTIERLPLDTVHPFLMYTVGQLQSKSGLYACIFITNMLRTGKAHVTLGKGNFVVSRVLLIERMLIQGKSNSLLGS